MKCPHKAHIALADGERFLLLRNDGQMFEPSLSVVAEPSLELTNYSSGVHHQDEPGMRKKETDFAELAHAAAVAEWLNKAVVTGEISELLIIADPKTLGEMRRHYHKELSRCLVGELDKSIATDPLDKVAEAIARA